MSNLRAQVGKQTQELDRLKSSQTPQRFDPSKAFKHHLKENQQPTSALSQSELLKRTCYTFYIYLYVLFIIHFKSNYAFSLFPRQQEIVLNYHSLTHLCVMPGLWMTLNMNTVTWWISTQMSWLCRWQCWSYLCRLYFVCEYNIKIVILFCVWIGITVVSHSISMCDWQPPFLNLTTVVHLLMGLIHWMFSYLVFQHWVCYCL